MKIDELKKRVKAAQETMGSMQLPIKASLVAMVGDRQLRSEEISETNVDLFGSRGCPFVPGQQLVRESQELFKQYDALSHSLEDKQKASKKAKSELATMARQLSRALRDLEFLDPQFELRFDQIDIEAIQGIKRHPVVQGVGKTEMSAASIRIVIG